MNVGKPLHNKASPDQFRATGLQPILIEDNQFHLEGNGQYLNNEIPGNPQGMQPQEPYLVFTRQPPDKYRFRYLSENGSHGQLKTASGFPTVELKNFHAPGPVKIKVEIYTCDIDLNRRKPHRILQFKARIPLYEYHSSRETAPKVPSHLAFSTAYTKRLLCSSEFTSAKQAGPRLPESVKDSNAGISVQCCSYKF
ncbi:uncharacterized protein [Macrobrachium rosenbergii]|uniref:uncharacterized protein isoform X1 n=1 Tax=Macrobrachium rosenbergii TaxID=79674 RepID=UPI0034D64DAA